MSEVGTAEQDKHQARNAYFMALEDAAQEMALNDVVYYHFPAPFGSKHLERRLRVMDSTFAYLVQSESLAKMVAAAKAYLSLETIDPESMPVVVRAARMCMALVLGPAWLAAIGSMVQRSATGNWFRTELLDEALLPRDAAAQEAFAAALVEHGKDTLTVAEARSLLAGMRVTAGGKVPDALTTILAANGIIVVG